jgi:hypothetical protein
MAATGESMSRTLTVSRVLLGLVFVVFGLDGLFHFFPLPPMPPAASAVIATLASYKLFHVVKGIEVGAGALLLANRRVTLALLVLAPVVFNIAWFGAFLDPASLPVVVLLVALEGVQLWSRRERLAPLFA